MTAKNYKDTERILMEIANHPILSVDILIRDFNFFIKKGLMPGEQIVLRQFLFDMIELSDLGRNSTSKDIRGFLAKLIKKIKTINSMGDGNN